MPREKINYYHGEHLEGVRKAARAAANVLDKLCSIVTPGMSTGEVDSLSADFMAEEGGRSADLGYQGFPGHICISLNDVVVHGIGRSDVIIQPGDLVSLDVTVDVDGYCGDTARTICAGQPAEGVAARLLEVTQQSLQDGIAVAVEGNSVSAISRAVETTVNNAGFSVVRDMVGHGCGFSMHELPEVPNYYTRGKSTPLKEGMIICIEPMVNVGTWRVKFDRRDGWTCRTQDGSLSAHFEHQILITHGKAEVLTCPSKQKIV